jgi:hypothetical protein
VEQSYSEFLEKRRKCTQCMMEYRPGRVFHRRVWERRLEDETRRSVERQQKLRREVLREVFGSLTNVPKPDRADLGPLPPPPQPQPRAASPPKRPLTQERRAVLRVKKVLEAVEKGGAQAVGVDQLRAALGPLSPPRPKSPGLAQPTSATPVPVPQQPMQAKPRAGPNNENTEGVRPAKPVPKAAAPATAEARPPVPAPVGRRKSSEGKAQPTKATEARKSSKMPKNPEEIFKKLLLT